MSIQDRLERSLRDLLVMVSKAQAPKRGSDYVLVHKKEMQRQLGCLRDVVQEMMDQYEVTEESRNRRALEIQKQGEQIIRNANHQAQDIYAASVLYTEDALGKIQSIIDEAEQASKNTLDRLRREMEEERRRVRSNQNELLTQLEDLKDTAKYMRLIEDRNREIAKAKAKRAENLKPRKYGRIPSNDSDMEQEAAAEDYTEEKFTPICPEIRVNPEYFKKAGYTPEDIPGTETEEKTAAVQKEKPKNGNKSSSKKKSKNKRKAAAKDEVKEISAEVKEHAPEDLSEEIAAEIVAGIAKEISAELPEHQEEEELPAWNRKASCDDGEEPIQYEKPVIKINPEYFEKRKKQNAAAGDFEEDFQADLETPAPYDDNKGSSPREKLQGIFPFGRKA